jgi:hypothetical protein
MRIRLPAIGLLLLISANAWADLRTFDVDFRYRQEVYAALRNVLISDPTNAVGAARYGRVELLPSGQILVDAHPDTLAQVEEVIRAVRDRPAGAAPRVSLRYWAVLGTRPEQDAEDPPGSAPVPPVLDDVLTELRRFHGELTYRLIGTAALATASGQTGRMDSQLLTVEHTAYVQEQTLNATISLQIQTFEPPPPGPTGGFNPFQTRVEFNTHLEVDAALGRGEFLVLGESTVRGGGLDGTLFYIVHWPEDE